MTTTDTAGTTDTAEARTVILAGLADRDPELAALLSAQFAMLDELVQFARDAGAALEKVAAIKMPPALSRLLGG